MCRPKVRRYVQMRALLYPGAKKRVREVGQLEIPGSSPKTREKTEDISRSQARQKQNPKFATRKSNRRREIAQHITGVLERIIAWPIPGEDERDRDYVRCRFLDLKELTQFIEVILDCRERHPGDDFRVLDVGTSLGVLPLALRSMGICASACDHPRFEGYAEWIEKEGVPYSSFDLMAGELPYASGSFDVITFKQVIEHLPFSPKQTLQSFYRLLRPGGLLLLSTPNLARLSTVVRLLFRKSIHAPLDQFFHSEFPFTGHYREYTLDEIKRMLVLIGFDVARTAYHQQHNVMFLLRQRKRFANNLFMPIIWKEILALAAWRPFTLLMPSLSQFLFVVARKPCAQYATGAEASS
ncbi:MAG: class I SAM-dependent methyltransferase [Terriglobia bacterium]